MAQGRLDAAAERFPLTPPGFVVLDKPRGPSSRQALDRLRRLAHVKQAGYAGTLDPLASGVLVCALGSATRLLRYRDEDAKRYEAVVELGRETDTDDAEGSVTATADASSVRRTDVEAALVAFRGPIRQRPPAYSAVSIGGERLYARARRGEAVEAPEREVTITTLSLLTWEPPRLTLDIACSKGTYIRSLAHDLGRALGCYAFLAGLRRTASGPFPLAAATPLERLEAEPLLLDQALLPLLAGLTGMPRLTLSAEEARRIGQGQRLRKPDAPAGLLALLTSEGQLVAVARADADGRIQPETVVRG